MVRSRHWRAMLLCAVVALSSVSAIGQTGQIDINVVTKGPVTDAILADLGRYGRVRDVLVEINGVTLRAPASELNAISRLSYVAAANPDAERTGSPIDSVAASSFINGFNTWNLDAINVTDLGAGRVTPFTGAGVYVAVLDTGLLDSWRQYFPQQRIATQFAKAFAGASPESGAEPTNQWEHDQNSHGTHVTSSIIGYSLFGTPINGAAPGATIIPVKVLNQSGSGFSSMIARGIIYIADLKATNALGTSPVVINMSLGGSALDAIEQAAIDYAIERGVVIVAAAGNEGNAGMSYPGAYAPVISVGASGWTRQWLPGADGNPNNWWNADQVADPTRAKDFYIADFSSRAKAGQDLDVIAPGSWVVGPYQLTSGSLSYFYNSGTSMASPHVAGIVALMLQKNGALSAAGVESILESSAIPMWVPPGNGCVGVVEPGATALVPQCWGADAIGRGLATANAALAMTPQ